MRDQGRTVDGSLQPDTGLLCAGVGSGGGSRAVTLSGTAQRRAEARKAAARRPMSFKPQAATCSANGACAQARKALPAGARRGLAGTVARGPGRQAREGPGSGLSAPTRRCRVWAPAQGPGVTDTTRESCLRVSVIAGAEVGRGGRGEKGARETVEEAGWPSWVGRPEQGDGGEEHPPWSRRGPLTPVPGRPVPHASQQDVGTLVPLLHLQPPPSAHPRSPQAPTLGSSSCPLGLSAALRRGLKPAGVWGGKKVRRQRG